MSASKVWEETWTCPHPEQVNWAPYDSPGCGLDLQGCDKSKERIALIAAAPDMARLLLEAEWAATHFSGRDHDACCPWCEQTKCGEPRLDCHTPDCRWVAVLRKAGVLP